MIDNLFPTKVKTTDTNRMLVEYCKRRAKTCCFDLEMKEEYDYSYNELKKNMDSDRAKKELGHAREQIMDSYIQYSFPPKEHRMVRYARNTVRAFDYCMNTDLSRRPGGGGQTPTEDLSFCSDNGEQGIAEHIYQVNISMSGRDIVVTQLWTKSTTDQSLTRTFEGLCRAHITSKNNYLPKRMSKSKYRLLWGVIPNNFKILLI
jgi:hypothetical protein